MKSLRTYLFATTSYAVLIGSASAADIALKAPPPPPAAVSNWTGPYVGLNAGVALDHSAFTDVDFFFFLLPTGPNNTFWTPKQTDFTGGVLAGYNWQVSRYVLGLEADLNGVTGKHTASIPSAALGGVFASTKMDWMSTVRARAGFLIDDATLLYATGGVAFTHFSDSWGAVAFPTFQFPPSSQSRAAGVFGGGVEHIFAPHWTARVEALHADFGTYTATVVNGQTYRTKFEHDTTMVRGALTYKW
jgi:outer membrane immunogenic protein